MPYLITKYNKTCDILQKTLQKAKFNDKNLNPLVILPVNIIVYY